MLYLHQYFLKTDIFCHRKLMRKNVNPQAGIAVIDINDVPELYSGIKYFDGDIAFADKISTIPNLTDVFKVTFVAVVFCLRGNLRIKLNNVEHVVNEREALYIGANTVVLYWSGLDL